RHAVVKTGHERWREAVVPTIQQPEIDPAGLIARSRERWARSRREIEQEIRLRQRTVSRTTKEALDGWD
ncbi:MAG: hypothetical protein ACRD4P_01770, partial [Bryobacteraceae bacterium]